VLLIKEANRTPQNTLSIFPQIHALFELFCELWRVYLCRRQTTAENHSWIWK